MSEFGSNLEAHLGIPMDARIILDACLANGLSDATLRSLVDNSEPESFGARGLRELGALYGFDNTIQDIADILAFRGAVT